MNRGKENSRHCAKMAVSSIRQWKSQYCLICQVQLKAIESERKIKVLSDQRTKKRMKEEEEHKDKTQKEETPPKMLELIKKEKLADLMHGNDRVMVVMPSIALLSQILGLRFVFHQDMDSIYRDSSWLKVTDLLVRRTENPKYLACYLPFRWNTQHWKQDTRQ